MKNLTWKRPLYWLHRLRSKVMDRRFTEVLFVASLTDAQQRGKGTLNQLWKRCERLTFLATTPDHVTDVQALVEICRSGSGSREEDTP